MRVTRTGWDDFYPDGERSAVFVGGNVLVLSALATEVLRAVPEGEDATDLAAVADHLEEQFGAPEGADLMTATEATVRELVERGVLAEA